MRRRRRGEAEGFNLSFLDCICCGFGAIILLLVLTKIGEPRALEQARQDLDGLVAKLEEELHQIRGETEILNRDLTVRREQLSEERVRIARLQGDLSKIQGEFAASRQMSEVNDIIEGRLLGAHQELSDEMKRLLGVTHRRKESDNLVGGIPVDSEYIIFVIDTSGSMKQGAWPLVVKKVREVLRTYPRVKGIQVMNDMGRYMYGTYAGKWIPDTPARRKAVVDRLRSWTSFSNSSPVEGIVHAIRRFYRRDRRMSLYVFGDDFTGKSINDVIREVARINKRAGDGVPRVRVHAFGFPVLFLAEKGKANRTRFAHLMRLLAEQNAGSFVGLHSLR